MIRPAPIHLISLAAYGTTLVVVACSTAIGTYWLDPPQRYSPPRFFASSGSALLDGVTRWDSQAYIGIALNGYTYEERWQSSVAYFPLYPVLIRVGFRATGLPPELVAVLIAHAALLPALLLFGAYANERWGPREGAFAVWLLAACPAGFFMRMAYTESLFLLLAVGALYAIHRNQPILLVAVLCGLASATRPVGVALAGALAMNCWKRASTLGERFATAVWALPLGVGGLAVYMVYLQAAFGEPLAFAKTQQPMARIVQVSPAEKAAILATGRPIWSAYQSTSAGYWENHKAEIPWWQSIQFVNPIAVVVAAAAIAYGALRGWLNGYEISVGVLLVAIPYVARGYEGAMLSQARYMSVVVPIYPVAAKWLLERHWMAAVLVVGASLFFLGVYTALYCAGYYVI